jgi:hypothetical protein
MATMMINKLEVQEMANENRWVVIHPLDDAPEQKVDTSALGPMKMTTSVKISLLSLRVYLILMLLLVFYRVFCQAGFFGLHAT